MSEVDMKIFEEEKMLSNPNNVIYKPIGLGFSPKPFYSKNITEDDINAKILEGLHRIYQKISEN